MGILSLINKWKEKLFQPSKKECHCRNEDKIHLVLDGLEIFLDRCFAYDYPHEVSIFVPRAELRKKKQRGEEIEEIEVLLNSITIVHSPQCLSDEEKRTSLKPAKIPKKNIVIGK